MQLTSNAIFDDLDGISFTLQSWNGQQPSDVTMQKKIQHETIASLRCDSHHREGTSGPVVPEQSW